MEDLERLLDYDFGDEAAAGNTPDINHYNATPGYSWPPDGTIQVQASDTAVSATQGKGFDLLYDRLDKMDQRMQRLEVGLNRLLSVFGQPTLDEVLKGSNGKGVPRSEDNVALGTANTPSVLEGHPEEHPQPPSDQKPQGLFNPSTSNHSTIQANDAAYPYKPLNHSGSQIRILILHPCKSSTEPVRADLKTISLDDPYGYASYGSYTALSYTWGPPIFSGSIKLNNHDFPVTENLEAALRHLRDVPARPFSTDQGVGSCTFWWIDQICINQSDVNERNEQVALMRRIYKSASSVHVWLGEEADDSSTAMDLFNALGAPPTHAPGEKAISYPTFSAEEIERHWSALVALFRRAWWERVWIRQEVALSSVVTLSCGQKSVNMDILGPVVTALKYVEELGYRVPLPSLPQGGNVVSWTYHAEQLTELRQNTNGGYTWVELEQLLPNARACKATDARDTVFSVLGLADPEVYPVTADYRQELKDVLLAATRTVITKEYGLDILGACQNPEKRNGLPSWVPDLSEPWKARPFQAYRDAGKSHMNELSVTDSDFGDVQVEGECLIVRGGLVDSVAFLCDDVVHGDASPEGLDAVYNAWKKFVLGVWKSKKLAGWEYYDFVKEDEPEIENNWIRFLTIFRDDAKAMSLPTRKQKKKKGAGKTTTNDADNNEIIQAIEEEVLNSTSHYHLNFKLIRCYLLPEAPASMSFHPNRRVHAGLRANGVGRRLCVTKRGYVALVPADAKIDDSIALFQGATFPYVLRKYGGKKRHVLVGEAFVPTYASRNGESLARDEFKMGLETVIRLY